MPAFARTVRFRLTIWYSSLLLVFGVAFVVALNVAVRLDPPSDGALILRLANGDEFELVNVGPGGATRDPSIAELFLRNTQDELYEANLRRLRNWSIFAVVGLAIASGVGGYVVSGILLRPVRDITQVASKITETNLSLRISHQGPDDEMKALADTLDSMIARLERSFERQRQFIQDASHELRTPLAAIRTNIDVAEMDGELTPVEYRDLLETVKTQTGRLTRLSEDLLLLTTNDGGSYEFEPVDSAALLREVVRQLQPLAASRQVQLLVEAHEPVEVTANGDMLFRCVFNLTDNAIKYSGEGSVVRLRARRAGASGLLEVIDNGAGIVPEDRERIFDRFYRLDKGRGRREGGTGLGLAIVRELTETMGGSVRVEPSPGRGSTFVLTLPAAPDVEPEPPAHAPLRPRPAPEPH